GVYRSKERIHKCTASIAADEPFTAGLPHSALDSAALLWLLWLRRNTCGASAPPARRYATPVGGDLRYALQAPPRIQPERPIAPAPHSRHCSVLLRRRIDPSDVVRASRSTPRYLLAV